MWNVTTINLLQRSQYWWNVLFFSGGNICVLLVHRKTQNFTIIVQDEQKIEQIYIDLH